MEICDLIDLGIGELVGLATPMAITAVVLYRCFRQLSSTGSGGGVMNLLAAGLGNKPWLVIAKGWPL